MTDFFNDLIRNAAAIFLHASIVLLDVVVIIGVEVKIGHKIRLHIVHRFCERFQEFVEIFLVEEDLVPIVTVFVEFLTAFGDGKVIIVATGRSYIKEIRPAFPGPDAFTINAFHSFVVVFVRHNDFFSVENY